MVQSLTRTTRSLVAPAALVQRRDDRLARAGLGQRRARVLEVEEHLVGGQGPRLVDELLAGARHRQAGPAGAAVTRSVGLAGLADGSSVEVGCGVARRCWHGGETPRRARDPPLTRTAEQLVTPSASGSASSSPLATIRTSPRTAPSRPRRHRRPHQHLQPRRPADLRALRDRQRRPAVGQHAAAGRGTPRAPRPPTRSPGPRPRRPAGQNTRACTCHVSRSTATTASPVSVRAWPRGSPPGRAAARATASGATGRNANGDPGRRDPGGQVRVEVVRRRDRRRAASASPARSGPTSGAAARHLGARRRRPAPAAAPPRTPARRRRGGSCPRSASAHAAPMLGCPAKGSSRAGVKIRSR